jgi:hypothetical protein
VNEFKPAWRIRSCMTGGGKRGWVLENTYKSGDSVGWTNFGYFASIKAAKAMAAHIRRKPINV